MTCKNNKIINFPYKVDIQIQANLVSGLIGRSHFNKIIDSFIRVLNINAYKMIDTFGETEKCDPLFDIYINKIPTKHENITQVCNTLEIISNFDIPISIKEKLKKHVICSFGKIHENKIIQIYLERYSSLSQNEINNESKKKSKYINL